MVDIYVVIDEEVVFETTTINDTEAIEINLNKFVASRGYKLVKIPPDPEDHIVLGEN